MTNQQKCIGVKLCPTVLGEFCDYCDFKISNMRPAQVEKYKENRINVAKKVYETYPEMINFRTITRQVNIRNQKDSYYTIDDVDSNNQSHIESIIARRLNTINKLKLYKINSTIRSRNIRYDRSIKFDMNK